MIWYNVDRVRGVGIMDNLSYFKGLIMCTKCGKKFNKKLNGFICSGFKNYGKDFCNSKFIPLNMLLDIIVRHCKIYKKDYSIKKVKLLILRIEIGNELV